MTSRQWGNWVKLRGGNLWCTVVGGVPNANLLISAAATRFSNGGGAPGGTGFCQGGTCPPLCQCIADSPTVLGVANAINRRLLAMRLMSKSTHSELLRKHLLTDWGLRDYPLVGFSPNLYLY